MRNRIGRRRRDRYLQMQEMKREDRFMIPASRLMIRKKKKTRTATGRQNSTGSLYWMKAVSRKSESGKEKVPRNYGRGSRFRQTTGTIMRKPKNGGSHGQNTVISIWNRINRLTIDPIKDRGSKLNHRFMKVSQQGKWNRQERFLTAVKSTERSGRGTGSGSRSWKRRRS